jgi:hypothetical protein
MAMIAVNGEPKRDEAGKFPSQGRPRLGRPKPTPTHQTLGSKMEMRLEVRKVHEDAVESVLGKLPAVTTSEEIMKIIGEEVVKLQRGGRVVALVSAPGKKMLNCVIVSRNGAGSEGCLNENASGLRRRHLERDGQQD